MKQIGLQPRNAHYYVLLQNIRAQGDSVRACKVIDEMIKNGIRPAPRCYEQAIFTCLSMRDLNSTSMYVLRIDTRIDMCFSRLLNNLYSSTSFSMNQARYALMLYTNVVIFCSNLKNIENALLFMKQMTDLQLIVPVHLRLDVACSAAEVNDSAAVEVILREFENLRTKIRMVSCLFNLFQVFVEKSGDEVIAPIKIEEGIFLSILNCAARTGQALLADQVMPS